MADTTRTKNIALDILSSACFITGGIIIGWLLWASPWAHDTTTGSSPTTTVAAAKATSTTSTTTSQGITLAAFQQITNGMTRAQVEQLIGEPGTVMSELGQPGDQLHTIVLMWTQDGTLGGNANVTLQGDAVVGKAQFGLR